jgi:hypothetical protein
MRTDGLASYVYCLANGAIAADVAVSLEDDSFNVSTSGNAGMIFGICVAALADNEYGWIKVKGFHASANVATSTAAEALLSHLSDVNGDFVTITAGDGVRAYCLVAESGGLADVWLR